MFVFILGALFVMIFTFLLISYVCYRITFAVPKKYDTKPQKLPGEEQYQAVQEELISLINHTATLPYEEVDMINRDGLRLHGYYFQKQVNLPLQIMFHGYRSTGFRDFCGALPLALECDCNVLIVDQRAHGKSEGKCLTFGIKEREDCVDWCRYAVEHCGPTTPIFLVGLSMGAATVMMASELDLPQNVVGIIADCGYSSPKEIICKVIKEDRKLPLKPSYFFVKMGAKLFAGVDLESTGAAKALAHTKLPVLLIHGEDDRFVPYTMVRQNYDACQSEKMILSVPNAGHGLSYIVAKEEYQKAVRTFVENYYK